MDERRVLIIDDGGSSHATALQQIIAASDDRFRLHAESCPGGSRACDERRLQGAAAEFAPAVAFIVLAAPEALANVRELPRRLALDANVVWFLVGEGFAPPQIAAALRSGFTDFLVPPLRAAEVLPRLLHHFEPHAPPDPTARELKERLGLGHIIGQSPALVSEMRRIPLMARCDASVLITGETGTGKEVFARTIHYLGRRSGNPFVAVNCGAIPPDLIENELFGHEAGAFTSAAAIRTGLVEGACGGTLFLDEIDSLPLSAQVKLLRLLQEKEFRRLGSSKTCRADVRVLAAANSDLESALRSGRLRSDLFYRLNVLPLRLPPLRERLEDLPILAEHFAAKYAREFERPVRRLSSMALARLQQHSWPGNVRELENVIERAVLLTEGRQLELDDLMLDGPSEKTHVRITFGEQKARVVRRFELGYLSALLARHEGNITRAAAEAGKDRRALFELLRKHHLRAQDFSRASQAG